MNSNQVKQTVIFFAILITLLFGIEKMLEWGAGQYHYGEFSKINDIADHKAEYQIACFGSSVGEVALDAPRLEKHTLHTAYNFCLDGTRFIQYNGLVKELNEYSTRCELVIMTETFFSLSPIDQLTEPDWYISHLDNPNIYNSLHQVQPMLALKLKYVPFYRYIVSRNSYYKASVFGIKSTLGHEIWIDSLKGFTPRYKTWEHDLDSLNKISKPIVITIDSATVAEYRKTLLEIRKKGRRVLIIIPPIHQDGLKLLVGMDKLRCTLASMKGDGIYFRDYSRTDLSAEKKYFYNNSHVNKAGSEKFMERLEVSVDSILSRRQK